jgi:hypothetical protein
VTRLADFADVIFWRSSRKLRQKNFGAAKFDAVEFGATEFDTAAFEVVEVTRSRLAPLLQVGHVA